MTDWIAKHNRYATTESQELFNVRKASDYREIDARVIGTQAQRKRWLRHKLWNRLPPLIRPLFYFFYRCILAGGFLDGARLSPTIPAGALVPDANRYQVPGTEEGRRVAALRAS